MIVAGMILLALTPISIIIVAWSRPARSVMNDASDFSPAPPGCLFHEEARRLNLALAAIRKAQGKRNPGDMEPGTPEWHAAVADFAADLLRHSDMLADSLPEKPERGIPERSR